MEFIIVTFILLVLELLYFKIASHYNIIDKPNHRSSHTKITLRGGGVIFPFAFVLYFVVSIIHRKEWFVPEQFWSFGLGLFLLSAISFLDDILDLSTKLRLIFHFLSVVLLIYFLGLWNVLPFWLLPIAFIFIIGVLNAYNFMDGINGITGVYSLVALATLYYVNQFKISFADIHFIVYPIFACLVFLFFNFRKIARCFAGDVGSMSIAFWVLALLGALVVKTKDFTYFLFLGVYGIEVVSTIIQRIKMKENILEAHRHHLYQLLVNKMNWQHLWVAALYGAIQLGINFSIIYWELNFWQGLLYLIVPFLIIYISAKYYIFKKTRNF